MDVLIANFHFLRPTWFAVIPLMVLINVLARQGRSKRDWQKYISPHLLKVMLVKPESKSGFGPNDLAMVMMLIWVVALAGPSWEKVPTPFGDDKAPLVIALELTDSMNDKDLLPSRIERARLKIQDLLERRRGAPTALVAYGSSAHTVLPLTEDYQVLKLYLNELSVDIMPVSPESQGEDLTAVFGLAERLMAKHHRGNLLLVGDGGFEKAFSHTGTPGSQELHTMKGYKHRVLYHLIAPEYPGSARIGIEGIERIPFQADNADIEQILDRLDARIETEQTAFDDETQWQDAGYYLVYLLVVLALFWFRPGMVLKW